MLSAHNEPLDQVLDVVGVQTVALIDLATGMVVAGVGSRGEELPDVAASMAYEARSVIQTYGQGGSRGDLDDITLTTASRLHLTKVLEYRRGDGLLLYVDVDLSQTNLALATLQIDHLSPDLLER